MVGSLMYLTATRPDLMYDVSLISIFMESPKDSHWKVGKIILRYVAGTLGYGLWTLIHHTILSKGKLTVILQEVLMIGKTHLVMLSIMVQI